MQLYTRYPKFFSMLDLVIFPREKRQNVFVYICIDKIEWIKFGYIFWSPFDILLWIDISVTLHCGLHPYIKTNFTVRTISVTIVTCVWM